MVPALVMVPCLPQMRGIQVTGLVSCSLIFQMLLSLSPPLIPRICATLPLTKFAFSAALPLMPFSFWAHSVRGALPVQSRAEVNACKDVTLQADCCVARHASNIYDITCVQIYA